MTTWKPIPGFEHYEASSEGQVRGPNGLLRQNIKPNGYINLGLFLDGKRKWKGVHGWVLLAFIGPVPEGQEVRHLDHDPKNNCLDNLAYGTRSDNRRDTRASFRGRGQKLSVEDVREIKRQLKYRKGADIAKDYGMYSSLISEINTGKKWVGV